MALLNWELCGSLLKQIFSRASADSALSENEPAGRPSAHQLTAWRCERCGEWQHHSLVFCHSCGTIRPDPIGPAMAKAESQADPTSRSRRPLAMRPQSTPPNSGGFTRPLTRRPDRLKAARLGV